MVCILPHAGAAIIGRSTREQQVLPLFFDWIKKNIRNLLSAFHWSTWRVSDSIKYLTNMAIVPLNVVFQIREGSRVKNMRKLATSPKKLLWETWDDLVRLIILSIDPLQFLIDTLSWKKCKLSDKKGTVRTKLGGLKNKYCLCIWCLENLGESWKIPGKALESCCWKRVRTWV